MFTDYAIGGATATLFYAEPTRMEMRGANEVDVRRMLRWASALEPDPIPGRWRVRARHAGSNWIVVVEPNPERQCLEAITAFPIAPPEP